MVSSGRKQSAVLCDEEVKEYLLGGESEGLWDSESDSANELDDCALLDVVVNGDSCEDDDVQDFVWEDMEN